MKGLRGVYEETEHECANRNHRRFRTKHPGRPQPSQREPETKPYCSFLRLLHKHGLTVADVLESFGDGNISHTYGTDQGPFGVSLVGRNGTIEIRTYVGGRLGYFELSPGGLV